jgi:HK97 gp10 family phage protein
MADVRVVLHHDEIAALLRDPGLPAELLAAAAPVARDAAGRAPHRTGAGAASIRAEAVLDGPEWTAQVTWDQLHFYMYFHERGTSRLSARPFLVPALEGLAS